MTLAVNMALNIKHQWRVSSGGCPMCDFEMVEGAIPPMVPGREAAGGQTPSVAGLQEVEHVRSVFPETWLWTNASVR